MSIVYSVNNISDLNSTVFPGVYIYEFPNDYNVVTAGDNAQMSVNGVNYGSTPFVVDAALSNALGENVIGALFNVSSSFSDFFQSGIFTLADDSKPYGFVLIWCINYQFLQIVSPMDYTGISTVITIDAAVAYPTISDVTITPNPADSGQGYIITADVT